MRTSLPTVLAFVLLLYSQFVCAISWWGDPAGRPVPKGMQNLVRKKEAGVQDILEEMLRDRLQVKPGQDWEPDETQTYIFSYWKPGNPVTNRRDGGEYSGLIVIQFKQTVTGKMWMAHTASVADVEETFDDSKKVLETEEAFEDADGLVVSWRKVEVTSFNKAWLKYRYVAHGTPQRSYDWELFGKLDLSQAPVGSVIRSMKTADRVIMRDLPDQKLTPGNYRRYVEAQLDWLQVEYPLATRKSDGERSSPARRAPDGQRMPRMT